MMICPTRRLLVHHSNHHQFGAKLRVSMIFLFALLLFPVAAQSFMIGMGTKQSAVFKTSLGVRGGGDEKSNKDQLVLVTGSSRGIGAAICRALAREGYKIAINYRDNKDEAQSLVKEIEEMGTGSEVHAFQADVSKEEEVKRMFDGVQQTFGMPPTGLVNNAGIMEMMEKDICKISRDTLDADLAVNTYGPFFCIKEFVERTSTTKGGKGGAIVNISSVSAEGGQPMAYAMSKAAQEAMTVGLSKTLPLEGIRINTVIPGMTATDMAPPALREAMSPFIPMRRPGDPSEPAEAVLFLLSDASSYCSGTKIRVAGGL